MYGLLRSCADFAQGLVGGFKILYGAFFDCTKGIFDRGKKLGMAFIKATKETAIIHVC